MRGKNTASGSAALNYTLDPRVPHRINAVAKAFGVSRDALKRLRDAEAITVYQFDYDRKSDYVMVEEFIAQYRACFRKVNETNETD